MVSGIGSLALRETLVRAVANGSADLRSPEGAAYERAMLLRAFGLCGLVGLLGWFVAWVAAAPVLAVPYAVAATALLLFHAPRRLEAR
jgi:Flp pilus assembly protein TadB